MIVKITVEQTGLLYRDVPQSLPEPAAIITTIASPSDKEYGTASISIVIEALPG